MHTAVLESRSTATKPAAKKRSAPLDPRVADRLLDLLSTDDDFRQLFQMSPQAALRNIGYQHSVRTENAASFVVNQIPEPFSLCEIGVLASKQAIREARAALRQTLMEGLAYISPNLDAVNLNSHNKQKGRRVQ